MEESAQIHLANEFVCDTIETSVSTRPWQVHRDKEKNYCTTTMYVDVVVVICLSYVVKVKEESVRVSGSCGC